MELAGRFEGGVDYTGEVKEEVERLFLQRREGRSRAAEI